MGGGSLERSEKKYRRGSLHANGGVLSIRLRSDQRFSCRDLNWRPREGIGPPGAAYGYLPETNSHKNLQKVTGFVGGFTWLRVRNQWWNSRLSRKIVNGEIRIPKCTIKSFGYGMDRPRPLIYLNGVCFAISTLSAVSIRTVRLQIDAPVSNKSWLFFNIVIQFKKMFNVFCWRLNYDGDR